MPVHGAPSRPQALFFGFSAEDPALVAMSSLVARAELVSPEAELEKHYHLLEWDLAVVKGEADPDRPVVWTIPPHMDLLALGGAGTGFVETTVQTDVAYAYKGGQPSKTLTVDDGLQQPLRGLITRELLPWLADQEYRPYLVEVAASGGSGPRFAAGTQWIKDAGGSIVAGQFDRRRLGSAGGHCWVAPFVPEHPEIWLGAAIDAWAARRPERYAERPTWEQDEEWQTPPEIAASAALQALEVERETILRDLSDRESAIRAEVLTAQQAAAVGARRLLSAQGDPLVSAVSDALRDIGFTVVDVDATLTGDARRVEDLHVEDPAEPTWTNLTEVKGYAGGARSSDLLSLANYAEMFRARKGELPDTRWYVVNHFLTDPPGRRAQVLAGADDHLDVFAETGGLTIDTRILFSLVRSVQLGLRDAADVRAELRRARGRLTWPPRSD